MNVRVSLVAAVALLAGGCGGGGTGGGGGEAKRVYVLPHTLDSGPRTHLLATGDFNGDGILDLVEIRESPTRGVAFRMSSGLRESPTLPSKGKLARGSAGYEPPSPHVFVWETASDLCVADMDADGCPDLVVAGGTARQVGVWRWDPEHRNEIMPPTTWEVLAVAVRVAAGDVNGDGRLDLVSLDEGSGDVSVLLQTSSSPLDFAPSSAPLSFGACHGLVLADMDRDGAMDVVTNDPAGDRLLFLYGGAAGFTLRESPTRHSTGRAMAVGDVDADGWLDVVVAAEDGRSVVCLHQRPAEPRVFDDVASPMGIAIDEEGVPVCGLAIGDPGVNGNLATVDPVVARMGRPAVNTALNHSRTITQPGLGLVDLDRDGRLDLVCAPLPTSPASDSSLLVVFGSTATRGGFGPSARRSGPIRLDSTPARCVCAGDFDADGHLDLAESVPDRRSLLLEYFEDGDIPSQDDFTNRATIGTTSQIHDCATADLDRDGLEDCVTATSSGVEIRFQDPASPGGFLPPLVLAPAQDCLSVAVGDVNGDGAPDVVVAAGPNGGTFLQDPQKPRSFLPAVQFPTPPVGTMFGCLALGDLDGDGHLDLVAIRESPSKAYYGKNTGKGFFDVFTEVSLGISHATDVAICDLDGDGDLDLAVAGDGLDGSCVVLQDGHVTVLKMSAPTPLLLQGGVRVAVGDVNGDGCVDVVTSGDEGVAVALQSPDVRGRFLPAYALSTEACGGLALGDLDRDGRLDVCFVESATGVLVSITGDPDFDLLRVVSLNGLPPGVPVRAMMVVQTNSVGSIGDPDFDLLVCCPSDPGATTGILSVWASTSSAP